MGTDGFRPKIGKKVKIEIPCAGVPPGSSVSIKVFEPHALGGDPLDTLEAKVDDAGGVARVSWTFDRSKKKDGGSSTVVFVAEAAGRVSMSPPIEFVDTFEATIKDAGGNPAANRFVVLHAARGDDIEARTDGDGNLSVEAPPGDYHLTLLGPAPALGDPAPAAQAIPEETKTDATTESIEEISPSVVATVDGVHFEFDKCFPLPSVIEQCRDVAKFVNKEPSRQVVATGHADRTGDDKYNLRLSEERARAIASYLRDAADDWMPFYSTPPWGKKWGTREDQHMLSALPHGGTPFLAGPVSDGETQAARDALKKFQASAGLPETGHADAVSRRALVLAYMQAEGTSVPPGKFIDVLGMGEYHPPQPPTTDDAKWRRVEIFLFKGDPKPPADECRKGKHPSCVVYDKWLSKAKPLPKTEPDPLHGLRWEAVGATDADPAVAKAAVGETVQLRALYGPRPDDAPVPTFTIFDAKDVAKKKPLATLTPTENADKTAATATWPVTAPWRAGTAAAKDKKAAAPKPGAASSLPTGEKNDVTLDLASIRRVTGRAPEGKEAVPATGAASDAGLPSGGPLASAAGDADVIPVVAVPEEPVELVGVLDGFAKAPERSQFEIYPEKPGGKGGSAGVVFVATMGDDVQTSPVLEVTGAGTPPLLVLDGKGTPAETTATFTFDPDDEQQKPLKQTAWVQVVVGELERLGVLSLAHATLANPRWLKSDGKPAAVLKAGQSVVLACDVKGANPDVPAVIELHDATAGAKPGTTPFQTLEAKVKSGVVSASWPVVAPPAPADAKDPAPVPEVAFVVRLGGDSVVSAPRAILPEIRITLEPGDPNWFFEPIVKHPDDPPAPASLAGEFEDHALDLDLDPDAKKKTAFPKRVLGIKERLQALGFYYETLPDPKFADPNKQTRVFRKCFEWYWKNVHPKDGSRAPTKNDPAADDELPKRGPRVIDVDALPDAWLLDLEDRVRKALLVPESGTKVVLGQATRIVLNGEHLFHNQEEHLADPAFRVDHTHVRSDGPYAEQPVFMAVDRADGDPEVRHVVEQQFFAHNPTLVAVPLVAKLETMKADGTFAPGPASGVNVVFQLVPVGDPKGPPAYLDQLGVRDFSRVTAPVGAFRKGPNPSGGPRGYLHAVHNALRPKDDPNGDPTWWNCPPTQGGAGTAAGGALALGAGPDEFGARAPARFPWVSIDASKLPGNAAHAVAVGTENATAALLLRPSRRGGDAYKLRVFIAGTDPTSGIETGTLTTWRRVRVTRYFKKPIAASLKQVAPAGDPQFTARDATVAGSPGIAPLDEVGGDLDEIDWKRVASIFSKAFIVLEPPAETRVLEQKQLDDAVVAAMRHVKRIITKDGTAPLDWSILDRRVPFSSPFKEKGIPIPPYDPEHLVAVGTETPFLVNYQAPDAHDAAGHEPKAGPFPYNFYFDVIRLLNDADLGGYVGLFLDDFDPNDAASFDPVPVPGITALQTLSSDNVTFGRGYQVIRTLGPLTTAFDPAKETTDLKALDATGSFQWSLLQPGDKIALARRRPGYVFTEIAKLPPPPEPEPGKPLPRDTAVEKHVFSNWPDKRIEFTYGEGHDGITLGALVKKFAAEVKKLARDPNASDILVEETRDSLVPPPKPDEEPPLPGANTNWLYLRHVVQGKPWPKDGFEVICEMVRGTKRLAARFLEGDSFPGRQADAPMGTSGYAQNVRSFLIHYGHNTYANAGMDGGPDPSGKKGRGYKVPSHMFSYDLATNAAHEIGHLLYLSHQWTSDDLPASAVIEHDFDDFCVMGYVTGFVEKDGVPQRSVPREEVFQGKHRDAGRADFCGRCLLKLRGWSLERTIVPANVPPEKGSSKGTTKGDEKDPPGWPGISSFVMKNGRPNKGILIKGSKAYVDKALDALRKIEQTFPGEILIGALDVLGMLGRGTTIKHGSDITQPGNWDRVFFPRSNENDAESLDKFNAAMRAASYEADPSHDGKSRVEMVPEKKGKGTFTTVFWDEDYNPTEGDPHCTEVAISLAHELIHAVHLAKGEGLTRYKDTTESAGNPDENMEEARTIGKDPYAGEYLTENTIRHDWNRVFGTQYPPRLTHAKLCGGVFH